MAYGEAKEVICSTQGKIEIAYLFLSGACFPFPPSFPSCIPTSWRTCWMWPMDFISVSWQKRAVLRKCLFLTVSWMTGTNRQNRFSEWVRLHRRWLTSIQIFTNGTKDHAVKITGRYGSLKCFFTQSPYGGWQMCCIYTMFSQSRCVWPPPSHKTGHRVARNVAAFLFIHGSVCCSCTVWGWIILRGLPSQ